MLFETIPASGDTGYYAPSAALGVYMYMCACTRKMDISVVLQVDGRQRRLG